jgi:hypothetical protein
MTYSFTLARAIKDFYRYELPGLKGSIYVPTSMVVGTTPTTISITADNLAEPKAVQQQDPAELQAAATKAAEAAQRASDRAAKLAAEVGRLKATAPPTPEQPVVRGKKSKAA